MASTREHSLPNIYYCQLICLFHNYFFHIFIRSILNELTLFACNIFLYKPPLLNYFHCHFHHSFHRVHQLEIHFRNCIENSHKDLRRYPSIFIVIDTPIFIAKLKRTRRRSLLSSRKIIDRSGHNYSGRKTRFSIRGRQWRGSEKKRVPWTSRKRVVAGMGKSWAKRRALEANSSIFRDFIGLRNNS